VNYFNKRDLNFTLKFLGIVLLSLVSSCGGGKKKPSTKQRSISVAAAENKRRGVYVAATPEKQAATTKRNTMPKADRIIGTALTYSGVRYKFGGTTKKGMDCSGLLYVAFGAHNVALPRTSIQMSEEGKNIGLRNVIKGDLLFFKTRKRSKRINHVGMVVSTDNNEVKFIHAASSRGVSVSSLREGFWNAAFVKAKRVL